MTRKRVGSALTLLAAGASCFGAASTAMGQGTARWGVLDMRTDDGDPWIDSRKGEDDIDITFGLLMDPSPGATLPDGSTVVGFGGVVANTFGERDWNTGIATWTINPDLIFLTGDLTTKDDATQDLLNITASQSPAVGPFSTSNPISILTINWQTHDPSSRFVASNILARSGSIQVYIRHPGASGVEIEEWPISPLEFYFFVDPIPAPATCLTVWAGALRLSTRRSRAV